MSSTITDQLLEFARTTPPRDALAMMRLSLVDWCACGIAGAREPDFAGFKASALSAGTGQAHVFRGGTAPAATAALINGTLSHALDYDDTHFAHIGHPSVAVLPAVLALADQTGTDFAETLAAATIGVEASILVGIWLGRGHYQVGYHQTATAGAFGATLGAARLLGLPEGQMRHALGLCASMASGIKAQFGTMAKPLNAGLAARSGVEAVLWAAQGMTAAEDGLAGPLGFGPTHHGVETAVTPGQGPWQITTISHKFHACCHGLHAMLEALRDAQAEGTPIESVTISTHPRWMSVCNISSPQTGLAAKFSYGQTAAMALLGHDTGAIGRFTDAITRDSAVVALRDRVTVIEDDSLTETQAEVSILHEGGAVQQLSHDLLAPMPIEVRAAKLEAKVSALIGAERAGALWQSVESGDRKAFMEQIAAG